MGVSQEFRSRWGAFRFPSGRRGFIGVTAEHDHFMILAGGLWTAFQVGKPFFLPWIVRDREGHGNLSGTLHFREEGRNVWARVQKLVRADYRDERPFGIVETVGEYAEDDRVCRLSVRFTFAAGFAGFLMEPTRVENCGKRALIMQNVLLHLNAGGGEKVVPLPDKGGWLYPDGRKTVVTAMEGGRAEFWLQPNGRAHPDIAWETGNAVVEPGASWAPSAPLAAVCSFEPFAETAQ